MPGCGGTGVDVFLRRGKHGSCKSHVSSCYKATSAVQTLIPRWELNIHFNLKTALWRVLYDSHALASELTASLNYTLHVLL